MTEVGTERCEVAAAKDKGKGKEVVLIAGSSKMVAAPVASGSGGGTK